MTAALPTNFAAQAIAIGASAGGIEALLQIFAGLQPAFHVPVIVVLHLPQHHESLLSELFTTKLGLPVSEAVPGATIQNGNIYFAPPSYHLLVEPDRTFSLSCDAPVLFSRPSIDVMLESCAEVYRQHLLGVVLTGANRDGASGLAAVKAHGGLTAVQDPSTAEHRAMPEAALRAAAPHFCLPLNELRDLVRAAAVRP